MSTHEHFKPHPRYRVACLSANALAHANTLESAWRKAQTAIAIGAPRVVIVDTHTGSCYAPDLDPALVEVLR